VDVLGVVEQVVVALTATVVAAALFGAVGRCFGPKSLCWLPRGLTALLREEWSSEQLL